MTGVQEVWLSNVGARGAIVTARNVATISAAHAEDQQLLGLQICSFDNILKLVVVAAHTLTELLGRFLQRFQSAFT
jgi:hypothetical protein